MNAKATRPARDRKPNDSCKCGAVLTAIFPRFRSQRLASKLSRKHTTSKLHASSLEWRLDNPQPDSSGIFELGTFSDARRCEPCYLAGNSRFVSQEKTEAGQQRAKDFRLLPELHG